MARFKPGEFQMPKHIAILIPNLGIGGAERISLDLAREFVRLGHKVDIVLMRKSGELLNEVPDGADLGRDLRSSQSRKIFKPLAAYLKQRRPDVLLANLWPLTAVAIAVVKGDLYR